MSEGSSCLVGSKRKCHCGLEVNRFMAWTPNNAGRPFVKCPMPKNQSYACDIERNNLTKKIADFEASAANDAVTITELREKLNALEVERNILTVNVSGVARLLSSRRGFNDRTYLSGSNQLLGH
ncbi:hypothetical protein K7X08_028523 [Anisodus acutangulus]|uniref:Uncharacterized protein n=1 Tax=Anisodus acutangulus TaxID=402998 RepID=A0A9Q1M6N8_9SOLA|nr:hypothetical protein K7X08_028523 [Anisodus acutangulus]